MTESTSEETSTIKPVEKMLAGPDGWLLPPTVLPLPLLAITKATENSKKVKKRGKKKPNLKNRKKTWKNNKDKRGRRTQNSKALAEDKTTVKNSRKVTVVLYI